MVTMEPERRNREQSNSCHAGWRRIDETSANLRKKRPFLVVSLLRKDRFVTNGWSSSIKRKGSPGLGGRRALRCVRCRPHIGFGYLEAWPRLLATERRA